jgi:NAD(P)H dehydrogenase (quinone)
MENVKLAVIYYSTTGTNYQLAQWAAKGGEQMGANVKILRVAELAKAEHIASNPAWQATIDKTRSIPEVSLADLEWADAVVFSMPTRYGNVPAQMKQFLDSTGGLWFQGKLANKVVSAMTSAQNPHGGQEATLLSLYTMMYHWGAIIAAPGYTDLAIFAAGGNPYGVSVSVDNEGMKTDVKEAVIHQARRTVMIAGWIKKGLAA